MKCPNCGLEDGIWVDHVERREYDGVTTETLFYACRNPQCSSHGKVFSATGQESEAQIKPKAM